ncbi:hypothetical protein [Streptomyces sp. NPDC060031]|uniref:hypothetical protein n=1 Tax=Streptomyces sp. NPDC060031 TaxID=3347043 RepID=UPI0036ACCC2F
MNTVERLINKLKAWRGIVTRCDKRPDSHLAGLHLRAAMIWDDDLIKTADFPFRPTGGYRPSGGPRADVPAPTTGCGRSRSQL